MALHVTAGAMVQVVQMSSTPLRPMWRTLLADHREAIITT
jgi:hypothetical protein